MDFKNFESLAVSDSGFIFNPKNGDTYNLNMVALEILKLLKEFKNIDKVVEKMVENYEIDKDTIQRDIDSFINQMKIYGLL